MSAGDKRGRSGNGASGDSLRGDERESKVPKTHAESSVASEAAMLVSSLSSSFASSSTSSSSSLAPPPRSSLLAGPQRTPPSISNSATPPPSSLLVSTPPQPSVSVFTPSPSTTIQDEKPENNATRDQERDSDEGDESPESYMVGHLPAMMGCRSVDCYTYAPLPFPLIWFTSHLPLNLSP